MTTAIILAGGLGKRLRAVVPDLPKPMAMIKNRPFLEYLMDYWIEQGITKFILSVGYLSEKIISHFGDEYRGIQLLYAVERNPLGTGGGLLLSLKKSTEEDTIILNGDTFFKINLDNFRKFHIKQKSILTIALFKFNERNRYGAINLDANNNVTSISVKSKDGSGFANGGVYYLNTKDFMEIFKQQINLKCSFEEDLIETLIKKISLVSGKIYLEEFIDIGLPSDYIASSKFV